MTIGLKKDTDWTKQSLILDFLIRASYFLLLEYFKYQTFT